MNKWEYLKIHVMLEEGMLLLYRSSKKVLKDDEVVDHINSLGKAGWELVSVSDEIGNERVANKEGQAIAGLLDLAIAGPRITAQNQHRAATLGYYFWFKRLYEAKICNNCKAENNSTDNFCYQCGAEISAAVSPVDYFRRGNLRREENKFEGALSDYSLAIRLKPDYADAYRKRGDTHLSLEILDKAIDDYNEAIKLQPDYAATYYNRAIVWRKKGNNKQAISDFQKYLDLGGGLRDGDQNKVEKFIMELKKKM